MNTSAVDPLSVSCPDCIVDAGEPCDTGDTYDAPHAARTRLAELRALPLGTCARCGKPLLLDGDNTRHPDPTDGRACAPMPDATVDWNAYATALNRGQREGYVSPDDWLPAP